MSTKPTNYRKWAFRLFIYLILTQIAIAFKAATYVDDSFITGVNSYDYAFAILAGLSSLFLLGGVVFTVLALIYKETKDYKYWISVCGYPIFIIASVILSYLR